MSANRKVIKLFRHKITRGALTAKVSYIFNARCQCVRIYERGYNRDFPKLLPKCYSNHSDSQVDYFDIGRIEIKAGHPLYAAALARALANNAHDRLRIQGKNAPSGHILMEFKADSINGEKAAKAAMEAYQNAAAALKGPVAVARHRR